MDDYMPALPPGFKRPSTSSTHDNNSNAEVDNKPASGPAEPEEVKRIGPIGPALPPGLKLNKSDTEDSSSSSSDSEDDSTPRSSGSAPSSSGAGPSFIGPAIPADLMPSQTGDDAPGGSGYGQRNDEDVIGPTPYAGPKVETSAKEEFEQRAQRMRDKLLNKDKEDAPIAREDWMMTLPEKMKKSIGVEAKSSFSRSRCTGERDDTWTETPAERELREQEEREGKRSTKRKHEEFIPSVRDKEMRSKVEEFNKKHKREKSLLEVHQKKLDKKKKKEKKKEKKKRKKMEKEGKKYKEERMPFDRERDLKTNHFDDAMKKTMLKRARGLGGRFETGGTSNKFL